MLELKNSMNTKRTKTIMPTNHKIIITKSLLLGYIVAPHSTVGAGGPASACVPIGDPARDGSFFFISFFVHGRGYTKIGGI